jgi:hypothetical protein
MRRCRQRVRLQRGVDAVGRCPGLAVELLAEERLDLGSTLVTGRCRRRPALQEGQRRDGRQLRERVERGRECGQQVMPQAVEKATLVAAGALVLAGQHPDLLDQGATGPQRLMPIAIGHQDPGEQLGIGGVGLAAGDAGPLAVPVDCLRVERKHHVAGVQERFDQQPVGALDRDQHDGRLHLDGGNRLAKPRQPAC